MNYSDPQKRKAKDSGQCRGSLDVLASVCQEAARVDAAASEVEILTGKQKQDS